MSSALDADQEHPPQVALLDYRMPGMDGAQVAAAVRRDELPTRVLLVSAHDESAIVYQRAAGGRGRISAQGVDPHRAGERRAGLCQGPRRLRAGSRRRPGRRDPPPAANPTPVLSPREREVLELIARGRSIPAMAKELFLAPSTVKTHVQRLYEKLGVGDRAAAVAEAMRRRLLE